MNIWADKIEDIRFSINDLYMIFLMTGWMFLFMGLYYKERLIALFGVLLVIINIWGIRSQFMLTTTQYIAGMIPHHSMAILMSRKLLEQNKQSPEFKEFVLNIIKTQEKEIEFMKQL